MHGGGKCGLVGTGSVTALRFLVLVAAMIAASDTELDVRMTFQLARFEGNNNTVASMG